VLMSRFIWELRNTFEFQSGYPLQGIDWLHSKGTSDALLLDLLSIVRVPLVCLEEIWSTVNVSFQHSLPQTLTIN
jgi:hypothetical protein